MSPRQARRARADMRARGVPTAAVPKYFKRFWSRLPHRERGKISGKWIRKQPAAPVASETEDARIEAEFQELLK